MNRLKKITASKDLTELLDNLDPITNPVTPEEDLPPEYCTYKDEGCELASACLECPFPQCAFDRPWGRVRLNSTHRDEEIRRVYQQTNKSIKELVKQFAVSERTVRRAIKTDGASPPNMPHPPATGR
jgi:hypothetical protein